MVPSGPGQPVTAGVDSQTPVSHATRACWPLLPGTRTRGMLHLTHGALLSPGDPEGHGKAETLGGLVGAAQCSWQSDMGPDFPWRRAEGGEALGVRVTWGGCQEPALSLDTQGKQKGATLSRLLESGTEASSYVAQN